MVGMHALLFIGSLRLCCCWCCQILFSDKSIEFKLQSVLVVTLAYKTLKLNFMCKS